MTMSYCKALCILAVLAQARAASISPEIQEGPNDQVKVEGSTAVMKCRVSGDPTPEVKWMRDNANVTDGRYNVSSEGDLVIRPVSLADAGRYQCYAKNEFGEKSAFASLTVKRRTIISSKPENCEVAAGSSATFQCNPVADDSIMDHLQIIWLKDGQRIDFDHQTRFQLRNDNALYIVYTTESDSGDYTCVAKTEIDEATAHATLTVKDSPPEIKEGPENLVTFDGSTAVMKCRVSGKPRPEVKWTRDNVEVFGGRYNVSSEGDLVIRRVTLADAGRYQCYAKNEFGEKSAFGSLTVKKRTIITDNSDYVEEVVGKLVVFRCTAVVDAPLHAEIVWLKDGQRIDFDDQLRFEFDANRDLNPSNEEYTSTLFINDAEVQDSGVYTCVARTEIDEARVQYTLRVLNIKKPGPVRSFVAYPVGSSALLLKWDKPVDDNNTLSGYRIYYQTVYGTELGPRLELRTDVAPKFLSTILARLHPGTKYRVYISATNKAGEGPELYLEQTTRVQAAKPDVPVFSAQAIKQIRFTNILVSWHLAPEGHPGSHFTAWYRPKGRSDWTHTSDIYDDDYAMLRGLERGQVYEVKISAHDGEFSTFSDVKEVAV